MNDYMFEDEDNNSVESDSNSGQTDGGYTEPEYTEPEHSDNQYTGSDYDNGDYTNAYYGSGPEVTRTKNQQGSKSSNGLAIASMVLGIISVVFFCSCFNIITAIAALVTGILFLAVFNTGKKGDKGMAISGIVMAIISVVALIVSWFFIFSAAYSPELINDIDEIYNGSESDEDSQKLIEDYLNSLDPAGDLPLEDDTL